MTTEIKNAIGDEEKSLESMITLFDELLRKSDEGTKKIVELVRSLDANKSTILTSVESLSAVSEENAASTQETSASLTQLNENMDTVTMCADGLRDVAVKLQENVAYFKVTDDSAQ